MNAPPRRSRPLLPLLLAAALTLLAGAAGAEPAGLSPTFRPPRPAAGRPLEVTVEIDHPDADRLQLFHRTRGQRAFQQLEVPGRVGTFVPTVPGDRVQPPAFEYYLVVVDRAGAVLARAGSEAAPLSLDVSGSGKPPVWKRGWFWGTLGGVLAAGALAAGLGVGLSRGIDPNTPGTLTVVPH